MEKNTVLLSLEDYNKLKEFKEKIENNFSIKKEYYGRYENYIYISTDSHVKKLIEETNKLMREGKELTDKNEELTKEIDKLRNNISKLEELLPKKIIKKEISLEDIKKMSYWEFKKWKKSNL